MDRGIIHSGAFFHVAAVGVEGIAVHIGQLIRSLGTRNIDGHNVIAVNLLNNEHILGRQHIHAALVGKKKCTIRSR